ncbi:MAG: LemA family protein [Planctomycetota bacterium]|nr:LemA family protein [Planctomycetota bacterium]
MKKVMIGCGVAAAVGIFFALILGLFVAMGYNGLVTLNQDVDQTWSQVQNVYQQRYDKIPNLVAVAQGAANFERSTLVEITRARASVGQVQIDPNSAPVDQAKLRQFEQAQASLGTALSRLLIVSERYPELRANTNFQTLMTQIEGTENRITVERQRFTVAVRDYNVKVLRFPTVLYAGLLGFHAKANFSAETEAGKAPKVEFPDLSPSRPSQPAGNVPSNVPSSAAPPDNAPEPTLVTPTYVPGPTPAHPPTMVPPKKLPAAPSAPAESPGLPGPATN